MSEATDAKTEAEQDVRTGPKQALAQERTDWAYARTVLAKERTYNAWVRTGLAAVAGGLGITRLLALTAPDMQPRWVVPLLGGVLVSIGGILFVVSFWRYRQPLQSNDEPMGHGTPTWLVGILTVLLLLATGLAVWLLL